MPLFRSGGVAGIARDTMEFVLEACEDTHPNEYMGILRGTPASRLDVDRDGQVVTDVLYIPGTEQNPVSATVKTNMIPNDRRTVGSVHSHPNGVLRPSDEDLATFGRGEVHIIVGAPYRWGDWRVFDRKGKPRDLEVLDVDLPDPEDFFDFDQSDIDAELDDDHDVGWEP
ncbi:proteasome protein [Halobacteriales archaeon QS_1_68_20]|nr:MAG: proteasome protein [Halobacteriales archaeon QS_1_68_20]